MTMSIDSGPELEKAKERIEAIRSLEIGSYPKAELVLIILGLKPATELDLAPWNDPPEKVEEALNAAGLAYQTIERSYDDIVRVDDWTTYLIAAKQQDVERLAKLDPRKDHQEYGRLMGFPETAIQGFVTGSVLAGDEYPSDPNNIIHMTLSRDHWQEEVAHTRKLSDAIKTFAPEIYKELRGDDTP